MIPQMIAAITPVSIASLIKIGFTIRIASVVDIINSAIFPIISRARLIFDEIPLLSVFLFETVFAATNIATVIIVFAKNAVMDNVATYTAGPMTAIALQKVSERISKSSASVFFILIHQTYFLYY